MDEWDNGIKMISIIIPAHNEEMYIDGILSDLKRQRHKDFEVIVSDDFSEDRTAALARKSGLKGIRVIEHKSRNASAARNIGAGAAKGEILAFIDADTRIYDTHFIEKIEEAFKENGAGACSVKIMVKPGEAIWLDNVMQGFFNFNDWFSNKIGLWGSRGECQIVRKDLFIKAGGYVPEIYVAEDVELFKRLMRFTKLTYLNNITVYESARRYRKEGYFLTTIRYCYNGLYAFVFKKSISRQWKPIR